MDRRTDEPMDQRTNERTYPLIEMRGAAKKGMFQKLKQISYRCMQFWSIKLEKAKINSYFFLFCTVEFDTPSFKQAQKLTGLSKNDAVSFY